MQLTLTASLNPPTRTHSRGDSPAHKGRVRNIFLETELGPHIERRSESGDLHDVLSLVLHDVVHAQLGGLKHNIRPWSPRTDRNTL